MRSQAEMLALKIELENMELREQIICQRCGSVDDYRISISGPHLKATCNGCDYYIKFLKKPDELRRAYKQQNQMADKIINIRLDVSKIVKDWLFKGEKGTYLDATVFYNEKQDDYGSNGMIVQGVPKTLYDKEKDLPKNQQTRGPILGNCKDWATANRNTESIPGGEAKPGKAADEAPQVADDLPF